MKNRKTNYFLRIFIIVLTSYLLAGALTIGLVYLILIIQIPVTSTAALLYIMATALCCIIVSSVFIYISTKTENRAMTDIKKALDKIAQGDYSAEIAITKNDKQLDEVIEKFNAIIAELNSVAILKNDFITNFSHEFKTPIASIKGFSELLCKNKNLSEEEREKYYKIINDESTRLSNLANMTLLLSKFDAQKVVFDKEPLFIDEQIEESALQFYEEVERKNLDVQTNLQHFQINASKELTKELWLNLFSNAVKYTEEDGHIEICSRENQESYIIDFKDDGIGISEEAMGHIFDAYYQENTSRTSRGIGLGLAICKRIVELHGWKIEVQSEKNVGSTFSVIMPKE